MGTRYRSILLALLVVYGCGGGGTDPGTPPPPPPATPPPPPPPPSATLTVEVRNNSFVPDNGTINAGETVVWTWLGQNHNVTSVLNPTFSPSSSTMNQPANFGPVTFSTAGTYRYICTVHGSVAGGQTGGMAGMITVN